MNFNESNPNLVKYIKSKINGNFMIEDYNCDPDKMKPDDLEPISFNNYSEIQKEDLIQVNKKCYEINGLYEWMSSRDPDKDPIGTAIPDGFFDNLERRVISRSMKGGKISSRRRNKKSSRHRRHRTHK